MVGEYDGGGTEIKTYGWKPDSVWCTDPVFMKIGSEYFFYHNDHLGTPQKMTAVNGAVVWSAQYGAFGRATAEVETVENNLRFGGQYWDGESGLHYNLYRYYDPNTGRYLRTDPVGLIGGINLYSYGYQNSINRVDPFGLKTKISMYTVGGQLLIAGGNLGYAHAKTECENGKYYEAEYFVFSGSLGAGIDVDIGIIAKLVLKNVVSSTASKDFYLDSNYPDSYISYLDIEGHGASLLYGATFIDAEVSTYRGGRRDIHLVSHGLTGEIGLQLFKFSGVNLVRIGSPKEKSCACQ